jgi:hypothetical protein
VHGGTASVTATRIDVFADPARDMPFVDPLRREHHVGLGCAVENLVLCTTRSVRGTATEAPYLARNVPTAVRDQLTAHVTDLRAMLETCGSAGKGRTFPVIELLVPKQADVGASVGKVRPHDQRSARPGSG